MALILPTSREKSWSHMGARGPWRAFCSIVKHNLNKAFVIWSEHMVVQSFTFNTKIKSIYILNTSGQVHWLLLIITTLPKILTFFTTIMYKLMLGEHEFKVKVLSSSVLWEFKSIEVKINPKPLLLRILQQYM